MIPSSHTPEYWGARDDTTIAWQYRYIDKFRQHQKQTDHLWEKQSIYRVPPRIRDLNPETYEPRVVSIGPYHHGKGNLEPMEEHKHRALRHFLRSRAYGMRLDDLVNQFREEKFLQAVKDCYAGPLGPQWSAVEWKSFSHLMVLDGCFVLELLLTFAGETCGETPQNADCYAVDDPIFGVNTEKHAVLPYVKMDLLLLENQLPLMVLLKLGAIAQLELQLNFIVREFYNCNHEQEPQPNEPLGLHILDVYRKSRLRTGEYTGWTVPYSAEELSQYDVRFKKNCGGEGGGPSSCRDCDFSTAHGSLKDIKFVKKKEKRLLATVYDHFMDPVASTMPSFFRRRWPFRLVPNGFWPWPFAQWSAEWYITSALLWCFHTVMSSFFLVVFWWYLPLWVLKGDLFLPVLVVDETTKPVLLNLMAFERLHFGKDGRDMAVTCYVFLMSSLIRSEKDVAKLREPRIITCLPERSDKTVVKLFRNITENVVVEGRRGAGTVNRDLVEMCRRKPNKLRAAWFRNYGMDLKTWVTVMLAMYGLAFTIVNTVVAVLGFVARRPTCH